MSKLSEADRDSVRLQDAVERDVFYERPPKLGILKSLLVSPLIGSELGIARPVEDGRKADL